MPEGINDRMCFSPPITSVWPALWPPWKRATAEAFSVSRSTILPLPSSPHWVPMTITKRPISRSLVRRSSTHQGKQQQPQHHADHTTDAQLPVAAARQLREHAAPAGGIEEGQQALEHEHQCQRRQQVGPGQVHGVLRSQETARLAAPARPEMPEELALGSNHPHVAFARQGVLVRLQAAVEVVELRRAAVGGGIDVRRLAITL